MVGTAIGVAASVVGGVIASKGAGQAGRAQADAANRAAITEADMYNQNRTDLMPYRSAGTNALDLYMQAATGKGFKHDDKGMVIDGEYEDVTDRYAGFEKSPGYQFRLDEGLKTLQNSASARGNLYSGSTLKAIERYGQDYATGDFTNYLNRLGVLSGSGQTATNTTAQLGAQSAQYQGNALMAAGDARASGYIGQANAWTNTLNQVGGMGKNIGGGGGVGASGPYNPIAASSGLPWSDIRLKADIMKVGEEKGVDIYEFRYLWDEKKRYRGVIAQDIRRTHPNAVVNQNGYLAVDYDALGLKMEEVACH